MPGVVCIGIYRGDIKVFCFVFHSNGVTWEYFPIGMQKSHLFSIVLEVP